VGEFTGGVILYDATIRQSKKRLPRKGIVVEVANAIKN
jgi:hypothetical protein